MNLEEKKIFLLNLSYITVIFTLVFFTVKFMLAYLMPFIIGIIIAYIVQKPSKTLSKKIKLKQGHCAALLAVSLYLFVLIIFLLLGWTLYSKGNGIIEKAGEVFYIAAEGIKNIGFWIRNKMVNLNDNTKNTIISLLTDSVKSFGATITDVLTSSLANFFKNLPAFFLSSAVTVVASCYIAKDYNILAKFLYNLINKEKYNNILTVKNIVTNNVLKFAWGYIILTLITFIELLVGFLCLGVDNPLLISLIVSLVDLLPVLGTGTVLLPWAIFSFFTDDIKSGVGFVCLYLIVCLLRNFLEPRIIGHQIGINPLFTLVSMFVGFKIAGIIGLIIFPIILIVIFEYYKIQIEKGKEPAFN